MWLHIVLSALVSICGTLGISQWISTKNAYEQRNALSKGVSIGWGILGVIWILLITVTSFLVYRPYQLVKDQH
jgi:ABC-type uncharacterized transport system permease subunit